MYSRTDRRAELMGEMRLRKV